MRYVLIDAANITISEDKNKKNRMKSEDEIIKKRMKSEDEITKNRMKSEDETSKNRMKSEDAPPTIPYEKRTFPFSLGNVRSFHFAKIAHGCAAITL